MFKKLLILILPITTMLTHAANNSNPYYLMNDVVNKTFTRLKNEQNKIHQDPNYLRVVVREELLPYIQIKYAGALLLRHHYREATPIQLNAYFKVFRNYLEQVYAQILTLYNNQAYQISQKKSLDNATIVTIRVTIFNNDRPPIHLDFQWRKNSISGNWQSYDMIVEGISMITTKQNEWASILRINGIDRLTRELKIASNQPINTFN